jgi:hypothetical protein
MLNKYLKIPANASESVPADAAEAKLSNTARTTWFFENFIFFMGGS